MKKLMPIRGGRGKRVEVKVLTKTPSYEENRRLIPWSNIPRGFWLVEEVETGVRHIVDKRILDA